MSLNTTFVYLAQAIFIQKPQLIRKGAWLARFLRRDFDGVLVRHVVELTDFNMKF